MRRGPVALAVAGVVLASPAFAACPERTSGGRPALCRNDFRVEIVQGPVLAPLSVTAMGGAYAAIADGVDGLSQNAAAATVRPPYSVNWFDHDLSVGAYLPGAFGKTDFDNRGETGLNSTAFFYTAGGVLQFGKFGVGLSADFQRYAVGASELGRGALVSYGRLHFSAGYTLLDGQLSVGAGMRGASLDVRTLAPDADPRGIFVQTEGSVLTMLGAAPEVGFLYRPDWQPWRIGATYRLPVTASGKPDQKITIDENGVKRAGGLALPTEVQMPYELQIGVALSAGPRPLNPHWIDPIEQEREVREELAAARRTRQAAFEIELARAQDPAELRRLLAEKARLDAYLDEEESDKLADLRRQLKYERRARYKNWPRARIQIVGEVLVVGPTKNAVGLQSFLRAEDVSSGAKRTAQPRLGIEGEPIPYRMIARVGTYLEPTRYDVTPRPGLLAGVRQHFTFGVEVRTFVWDWFGLSGDKDFAFTFAGDIAPRYQNLGIGIFGVWH